MVTYMFGGIVIFPLTMIGQVEQNGGDKREIKKRKEKKNKTQAKLQDH